MVWATGAVVAMVLAATGGMTALNIGANAAGAAVEAAGETVSSGYFANVMLRSDGAQGQPGQSIMGVDPDAQQEIAGILTRSAMDGDMSERDRTYLARIVAANSDLSAAEARARVDEVNAEISQARETAAEAADRARVAGVIFGFIAAATLLLGAVAAFAAAGAGGRHRDEGLGFNAFTLARR